MKYSVFVLVLAGLVLGACASTNSDSVLLETVADERAASGLPVSDDFIFWAADDMCDSMQAAIRNQASVSDWADGMYALNSDASSEQMDLMFAIAGAAVVTTCPDVRTWASDA